MPNKSPSDLARLAARIKADRHFEDRLEYMPADLAAMYTLSDADAATLYRLIRE